VTETLDVYAGYCTTRFTTARGRDSGEPDQRLHRGRVVAVRKPDDTVLVHDADGYQPVAWLTRPNEVWVDETPTTPCGDPETSGDQSVTASAEPPDTDAADGVELVAIDGDERLTVRFDPEPAVTRHVVTAAGAPAGDCHWTVTAAANSSRRAGRYTVSTVPPATPCRGVAKWWTRRVRRAGCRSCRLNAANSSGCVSTATVSRWRRPSRRRLTAGWTVRTVAPHCGWRTTVGVSSWGVTTTRRVRRRSRSRRV
jgi:hypothetical protein